MKNCPKQKKDLRDEKPSLVRVAEGLTYLMEMAYFLVSVESPRKLDWILDSNCSFYMCSIR